MRFKATPEAPISYSAPRQQATLEEIITSTFQLITMLYPGIPGDPWSGTRVILGLMLGWYYGDTVVMPSDTEVVIYENGED